MEKRLFLMVAFVTLVVGFNFIKADLIIDGDGGSLELSPTGTIGVATGGKLTLRNVTVDKLSGNAVTGRLVMHNTISQLVLQNSTLSLDGNYSFTQGSLVIKGDSTITGTTGTLFTFNGHNILIDHGATLKVKNITFQAAPTARNRQLVKFGNETSQFLLEDATFKANNAPTGLLRSGGLVMVGGNLVIEGSSIIDNSSTSSMHALQLGNAGYSSSDCRLVVRPNSKLTVKNAGVVFKNVGSGSLDLSGGRGTLDIDSTTNANFLIETPVNLSNSTFNFDFSTLKGLTRNIFYGLDSTTTVSDHGANINSINWSFDGQYLAMGGFKGTNVHQHRIYGFDGSTFTHLFGCNVNSGAAALTSVSWGPDGKYFAIGGYQGFGSYTHRVYSFSNDATTTLENCNVNHGNTVSSVSLSLDGRYLAIGGYQGAGSYTHRVYSFDGSVTMTLSGCNKDHGDIIRSISWRPDGKYFAIGGKQGTGSYTCRIYRFDGSNLTELINCRKNHGGEVYSVSWSPDGRYLTIGGVQVGGNVTHRVYDFNGISLTEVALDLGGTSDHGGVVNSVSWSPDGRYLTIGGVRAGGNVSHRIYHFNGISLTEVALDLGGTSDHGDVVSSVSWYPDGRYLAIGGFQSSDSMTHRVYPSQFTNSQALMKLEDSYISLQKDLTLQNIMLRTYGS